VRGGPRAGDPAADAIVVVAMSCFPSLEFRSTADARSLRLGRVYGQGV